VQNNFLNDDAESSKTRERKRKSPGDGAPLIDKVDIFFNENENGDEDEEADPLHVFIDKNMSENTSSVGSCNIGNVPVSHKFNEFRNVSIRKAKTIGLFLESQMEHILLLSSILVLKPDQHRLDLLEHFKIEQLNTICHELESNLVTNYKEVDISDLLVLSTKKVIKVNICR
jgi:hypothetical protein